MNKTHLIKKNGNTACGTGSKVATGLVVGVRLTDRGTDGRSLLHTVDCKNCEAYLANLRAMVAAKAGR